MSPKIVAEFDDSAIVKKCFAKKVLAYFARSSPVLWAYSQR